MWKYVSILKKSHIETINKISIDNNKLFLNCINLASAKCASCKCPTSFAKANPYKHITILGECSAIKGIFLKGERQLSTIPLLHIYIKTHILFHGKDVSRQTKTI